MTLSKIIEQLKAADQNKTGMFELGEDVMCALVELLERRERAEPFVCPKCGNTGLADSGGVQPWGEPILIECDCTTPPAPVVPEAIENAIEYIKSIAFHIDENDYHGQHIAHFMQQAIMWLEGDACRAAMLQGAEPVSGAYKLPSGWIKCSERMPDEGAEVYIFCDGEWVLEAQYRQGDFYDVVRDGSEVFETVARCVSHWQPRPQKPAAPGKDG